MRLVIIALAGLFARTAHAQADTTHRWITLKADSLSTLMLDSATIRHEGSLSSYWVQERLNTQRYSTSVKRPYSRAMVQWEMDCEARTSRIRYVAFYAKDGEALGVFGPSSLPSNDANPIIPGSEGEWEAHLVCSSP